MRTERPSHPRAFTLIELILVLVVLSIILAMTAPSLRGWGQGAKLKDATQQLLATTRFARAQAIASATPHRVELDPQGNAYAVTRLDGTAFVPVDGEFGQTTRLPSGFRVDLASGGVDGRAVEFYPSARTTPGVLRVTAPAGQRGELACTFPADTFRLVAATGGAR